MKLIFCFISFLWAFINTFQLPPDMIYLAETMNPQVDEQGNKFFEGDMILNKEQQEIINSKTDRTGDRHLTRKWPNKTVILKIDKGLANSLGRIRNAIKNWQSNTCISFVEATSEDRVFAHFKKGTECSSPVGYQGTEQVISIAYGCHYPGTLEHKIGHTLGLFHEQSRPDRDEFVTVFLDNVKLNYTNNFQKIETIDTYGIPYDIDSIMHYGPKDFSKNGEDTIVPNNPLYYFRMGQRIAISFYDFKLVNSMYDCSENCPNPPICQNDGYVNTKCTCACPMGFSGVNCEIGQQLPPCHFCTFDVTATGLITSPTFPTNDTDDACVWRITAPEGQRVSIHFRSFNTRPPLNPINYPDMTELCYFEYLELRMENLVRGRKYCGTQLNNQTMTSTGNVAALLLVGSFASFAKFEADVQFIN